ncbi:MAG: hypothetical protein KAI24_01475 [Planctomycetes bacterium]|nr:hypothetical protein [Planctomycetota bacterium]
MTDTGTPSDLASLEPLEPLEGAAPAAAAPQDPMAAQRAGLGAPAFNMYCTDKSMYRFLFAGVMMFVGCMMPLSAELSRAGYQSLAGGFYLLISIAMIWSWWGSIANNRATGVKWVLAAAIPLIGSIWYTISFDVAAAHEAARANGWLTADVTYSESLGAVFADMASALGKDNEAALRVSGFWRLFGPGNVMLLLGALLAEAGLFMGVAGGMKQNKQATQEKRMKAAERKRK